LYSVHQPVEEELYVILYDAVKLYLRASLYFPLSVVLAAFPTPVNANNILTFELCAVHLVVALAKLTNSVEQNDYSADYIGLFM